MAKEGLNKVQRKGKGIPLAIAIPSPLVGCPVSVVLSYLVRQLTAIEQIYALSEGLEPEAERDT